MKSIVKILEGVLITVNAVVFTACTDDDFTASIFDTTEYSLDKASYTFPLDTFLKKNFLEPYNLKYIYKMEDIGSDLDKNLVPINYENATVLAVLSKYLWFDVYKKIVGEEFLKQYSPRIIHLIGSHSFNPTSGTETLGVAEGGVKVTLIRGNFLDVNNIEYMNEYFFGTMHHEFSHILQQNVITPTAFDAISKSLYNPIDWNNTADSLAVTKGFISPYASSQAREDWVEVIAKYVTMDMKKWDATLEAARYDWEELEYNAKAFDAAIERGANRDTLGYHIIRTVGGDPEVGSRKDGEIDTWKIQRKLIQRNADGSAVLDENQKPVFRFEDGVDGRAIILQKLEMARQWLKDNFNVDLEALRMEVQRRQFLTDADGNFVFDAKGNYVNRFTSPSESDPTRMFIDELLDEVNQYKALQQ